MCRRHVAVGRDFATHRVKTVAEAVERDFANPAAGGQVGKIDRDVVQAPGLRIGKRRLDMDGQLQRAMGRNQIMKCHKRTHAPQSRATEKCHEHIFGIRRRFRAAQSGDATRPAREGTKRVYRQRSIGRLGGIDRVAHPRVPISLAQGRNLVIHCPRGLSGGSVAMENVETAC